jgi:Zn-dependent peptidase ImmA (M78 family)
VIWVRDQTGRFPTRPHFEPDEIEAECEQLVAAFFRDKYGQSFSAPWRTEDLVTLLEQHAGKVDLYADLISREGVDVEGATTFRRGQAPFIEIEATLAGDTRRENRLRTTLTHECTHVVLHRAVWETLWERQAAPSFLDTEGIREHRGRCHRATMLRAHGTDWMEWQAGYGSGAILMPRNDFDAAAERARQLLALHGRVFHGTPEEQALADNLAERYQVSREAARVRLAVRRHTVPATSAAQGDLL